MRVSLLAAVCVAFAGAARPAAAEPIHSPSSAPTETIGKAAAGKPKPYRSEVFSECGATQCVVDFGKKQKTRNLTLVNCAASVANGTVVLGEVDLGDPAAVVGYMAEISKAHVDALEYSAYEYDHRFVVDGGRKLMVSLHASASIAGMRCIVEGTIE